MPSVRSARAGSVAAAAVLALSLAEPAAAQPAAGSELDSGIGLALHFGIALVINLVLGGALLALAPEYARTTVAAVRDDPGTAFLWGLLVGIGVPVALVVLAITIIGLLIAIPGLLALVVLGLVGNAVTICWIGTVLTGDEAPDGAAVGVGALVLALLAPIPILGSLVSTILGFFGLGVVGRDIYTSWQD